MVGNRLLDRRRSPDQRRPARLASLTSPDLVTRTELQVNHRASPSRGLLRAAHGEQEEGSPALRQVRTRLVTNPRQDRTQALGLLQ